MGSATLPAMKTAPKFIFFSDFDGTITLRDSNDYLTDNLGYGEKLRKQGNQDVLHERVSFRDAFRDMLDSVKTPFDQCIKTLVDNIKLDPYFEEFYDWARANNVPVVILSGGMTPIIRALLFHLVGQHAEEIQIVSNEVVSRGGKDINEEAGWEIAFHDESHFGHDKSIEIRQYTNLPDDERPIMFYAGDGVSDLSAAKETDLLFAKKGHDLVTYCVREKVPFTQFEDWSSILAIVKDIASGKTNVKDVSAAGMETFKHEGLKK